VDHFVQLAGDAPEVDRGGGNEHQTLPVVAVDHRQDPETPAVSQLVVDKVQAPALVGGQRYLDQPPRSDRSTAGR